MNRTLCYIVVCILLFSCKERSSQHALFLSHELPFSNTLESTTSLNILNYLYYYNGAGTALADFNNDSLLDIVLISNLEANQLLLNRGNLVFENIPFPTKSQNKFTTGVTTVDINNDGLLDLYISQVSNHLQLTGHNTLYINKGNANGIPSFEDQSAQYGLDLQGLYTQAAFFDYDLDGDLDVYLLKHSVHPNSNYNRGAVRYITDSIHGDKLLKNNNGIFQDISQEAGILQNKISYGLSAGISDLNNDGYPDIYVGNDFFENDYLYINQKDGTFQELNTRDNTLGHTTHFSMGNDLADLNNDGLVDILSMDMLPEDLVTLKAAGTEYGYPIYQNQLRQGYQPQFMQNTLHLNLGANQFSESAFASGIAATEWSWAPLAADFDNDGHKDVFITNGIAGATNDMDFINFISNDEIQKKLGTGMQEKDLAFIKKLPPKITPNYFFKNLGANTFEDVTATWFNKTPSISNGASYGDLDNDGDLDLVVNNVNAPAQLLENRQQQQDSTHYLKVRFKGPNTNKNGIGTKVTLYHKNQKQVIENYTSRGFLSAIDPSIHFGLNDVNRVDSLEVIWPGGTFQMIRNIKANQTLLVDHTLATGNYYAQKHQKEPSLLENNPSPIDYVHKDAISLDFSRDPLIPYASSNTGPKITASDLNQDGLDDIVALGAKSQATQIYYQLNDGSFRPAKLDNSTAFDINEDVAASIFDANQDGKNDLILVSGGNEFTTGKPLQPRLYLQTKDGLRFRESVFSKYPMNASKVVPVDLDNDGDLDVSIVSNGVPREFGKTAKQYLFENDGQGNFTEVTQQYGEEFQNIGNAYDISWQDMDGNGYNDALVIGHWMAPTLFLNDGKTLTRKNTSLESITGWWNTLEVADFDKDGDLDIMAGNWGLNTRLQASQQQPIQLYRNDFDQNGRIDPIVTYFYKDKETTIATKDELVKQLPFINKKYLSYNDFARASLQDIFSKELLDKAQKKKVTQLASMYFENDGANNFSVHKLPFMAQLSSVKDIYIDDFNNDSYPDALIVGNDFEISTQLGRLDALKGLLLLNDTKGFFTPHFSQNFNISGAARSITTLDIKGKTHYLVGRNNKAPILLKKTTD